MAKRTKKPNSIKEAVVVDDYGNTHRFDNYKAAENAAKQIANGGVKADIYVPATVSGRSGMVRYTTIDPPQKGKKHTPDYTGVTSRKPARITPKRRSIR